jgi:hypothetical protein
MEGGSFDADEAAEWRLERFLLCFYGFECDFGEFLVT